MKNASVFQGVSLARSVEIDLQAVLDENDGVVPQDVSLKLLTQLKAKNESMSGLEEADLETLSEVMDFLPFGAGDPLITKWLGYIAMGRRRHHRGSPPCPPGSCSVECVLRRHAHRRLWGRVEGGVIAAIRITRSRKWSPPRCRCASIAKESFKTCRITDQEERQTEKKTSQQEKKGKKRRSSVHAAAKVEVLYRSKASLKSKMDNMKNAEKKRKMQAKNEKLARKNPRLKAMLEER